MLEDALHAPLRSTDAVGTTLLGGALTAFAVGLPPVALVVAPVAPAALAGLPVAFVASLLLRGYFVRTLRAARRGDRTAPSFVRWGDLLRAGVRSWVVDAGYLAPVALALTAAVGVPLAVSAGTLNAPRWVAGSVSAATVLIAAGYGFAYLYLRPAALARLAATGRLRSAFALRGVLATGATGRYVTGWTLALLALAGGGALAGSFAVVLVGFVGLFYVRSVAYQLYGRGSAPGTGSEDAAKGTESEGGPSGERVEDRAGAGVVASDGPAVGRRTPEIAAAVQVGRSVDRPVAPLESTDDVRGAGVEDGDGTGDATSDGDGTNDGSGDGSARGGDGFEWGPSRPT